MVVKATFATNEIPWFNFLHVSISDGLEGSGAST